MSESFNAREFGIGLFLLGLCHVGYLSVVYFSISQDWVIALYADLFQNGDRLHAGLGVLIYGILFTGFVQILYVWPLYLYMSRKAPKDRTQGFLFGAIITMFASGACFLPSLF